MPILHVEHRVSGYATWKKAYDSDPLDRKSLGLKSFRISRPVDDANYVFVDLEFDTMREAEAALASLRLLWQQIDGRLIFSPKARILNVEVTGKLP